MESFRQCGPSLKRGILCIPAQGFTQQACSMSSSRCTTKPQPSQKLPSRDSLAESRVSSRAP
eukprot:799046-Amphidinium_carterae.1